MLINLLKLIPGSSGIAYGIDHCLARLQLSLNLIMDMHPIIFWGFVFCFFSAIGSFLNVVIYRLPIMISNIETGNKSANKEFNLSVPRSRCPTCDTAIPWYANIPVASWALLRGKSLCCGTRISPQYFFVELGIGILATAIFLVLGFNLESISLAVLLITLFTLGTIDYQTGYLPVSLTGPLMVAGLAFSGFTLSSVAGAAVGYLVPFVVNELALRIKQRNVIGGGDMMLLSAAGAWCGIFSIVDIIFLTSLLAFVPAIIYSCTNKKTIYVGPYIALAIALTYITQMTGIDIRIILGS